MATPDQIADETRRAQKVRQIVDIATSLLMQSNMGRQEAHELVAVARDRILALFPGREETFEILYSRRFERLIDEFADAPAGRRGRLIPFRSRAERAMGAREPSSIEDVQGPNHRPKPGV